MDDKRTYKTHKEYSEDMSYENEGKIVKLDLTKQIGDLKQEIEASKDKLAEACNMCAGYRQEIEKIKKNQDIINDRFQIEMLEKDRDLTIKDKEIGRLMAKVNYGK